MNKKIEVALFWGFPFLLIMAGTMIMIWAGVNDCPGCNVYESITLAMAKWGYIGVAIFVVGLISFIYRIFVAWDNALNKKK